MAKRTLDSDTLLRLRKRMLIHASKAGNRQPEDIASEYVLRLLEGLHQHATVGQAYIDIVRTEANSRSKYYHQQLNLHSGTLDSEKVLPFLPDESDSISVDDRMDLEKYVSRIENPRTQKIFRMRLLGFNLKEIADDLGVTESMISQIMIKQLKD